MFIGLRLADAGAGVGKLTVLELQQKLAVAPGRIRQVDVGLERGGAAVEAVAEWLARGRVEPLRSLGFDDQARIQAYLLVGRGDRSGRA